MWIHRPLMAALIALFFQGAGLRAQAHLNPSEITLESRLEKALLVLRDSQNKSEEIQRYSAEALTLIFFDKALILDQALTEKLSRRFSSFLRDHGAGFNVTSLQALITSFENRLEDLRESTAYEKTGWKASLIVAFMVPMVVHMADFGIYIAVPPINVVGQFMKQLISRRRSSGALFRLDGLPLKNALKASRYALTKRAMGCRSRVARAALMTTARLVYFHHPRVFYAAVGYWAQSSLEMGLGVYFASKNFYFGRHEDWDATESEVEDHLLPELKQLQEEASGSSQFTLPSDH